jgi:diguanylate cyclase (GGDEF)-like protein/PAS domain S-box-containing protein
LRCLLEAIPSPLVVVDSRGTIGLANTPAEQLLGYAPAELRGQPLECLVPARLRAQHQEHRASFQSNPHTRLLGERQTLYALRKDGREIPVEIGLSSLQTKTEWLVLAVIMDVSALRRTEERLRRRERELALIADNIPALLAYVDADGCYRFVNQRYEEWFGKPPAAIRGRHCRALVGEAAYAKMRPRIEAALAGQYVTYDDAFSYRSWGWRWITATYVPDIGDEGRVKGFYSLIFDITARKRMEEALKESEACYRELFNNINSGVAVYEAVNNGNNFVLHDMNRAAEHIERLNKTDALGKFALELFPAIKRSGLFKVLRRVWQTGQPEHYSAAWYQDSQITSWREHYVYKLPASKLVVVYEDVTEARRIASEMSHQATHDALTGLLNRRAFEQCLQRVLETAHSRHTKHALCYLDLDQFKLINDGCGHTAGDALLGQIAGLLQSKIRKRDTLARLGGDEFGVLLELCTLEQACRVAEALRSAIEKFRFVWEGRLFNIGASFGLVPITDASDSLTGVLRAADAACYVAKDRGRNCIHVFREDDAALAKRHREMQWISQLPRALEANRFRLCVQPIVPIAPSTPALLHHELLLRLETPEGQLVPPGAFLPAAERYQLAPKIDTWVVGSALRWLKRSPRELERLHLCSLNLSGLSLGNAEFLTFVLCQFTETGVPAEKICFEITETAAIANLPDACCFIRALRDLGCRFALDDFGSGLSSFAYLKNLEVDFIKIDGTFVRNIAEDPLDRAMVKYINEIGQLMGKQTIAEFVENELILAELKAIGVDYAQGYYLGEPRPLEDMGTVQNPLGDEWQSTA